MRCGVGNPKSLVAAVIGFGYIIMPSDSMAQTLGGGGMTMPWGRVVLALLFCLVLTVIAALWLKKTKGSPFDFASLRGAGEQHSFIKVLSSTRLAARTELKLVACNGDHFLIAVSPQGVALIGRFAAGEPVPVATPS
jgi:flagellar biogenesis protein FliO